MASKKINNISCSLINIQSVGNKTIKIRNLINELKLDNIICILIETWLWGDVRDNSKIKEMKPITHDFYQLPRKDRIGGGVGILISKSFSKVILRNQLYFETFEYIDLEISFNNKNLRIIAIYKPPDRSEKKFLDEFENLLDTINDLRTVLICGDFNLRLDEANRNEIEFLELLETHNLMNSVTDPTTIHNHILDLVIHYKDPNLIKKLEVEPDFSVSPVHKLVTFCVDFEKFQSIRKKIIYRDKSRFSAVEFIDDCITKIDNENISCECLSGLQSETCVDCYADKSNILCSETYTEKCPIIEKTNNN